MPQASKLSALMSPSLAENHFCGRIFRSSSNDWLKNGGFSRSQY
jgi:hypothetical protein